jgi:hypothetical protein
LHAFSPETPAEDQEAVVLGATRSLLAAITSGDFELYELLCSADMTAIEPETGGQVVAGLGFHKHYFDAAAAASAASAAASPVTTTTISDVTVRMMGSSAVVTYNRLTQRSFSNAVVQQETRVWERMPRPPPGKPSNGFCEWVNVHFHKSSVA